ncbi:hypothetical protein C8J55DRAFT_405764, partial [Lentinula edodes]
KGGIYGNALQAFIFDGTMNGGRNRMRIVIENGADIETQSGEYDKVLEKGVNVNIQGGKYGSALQAAAFSGNK